VLATSSHSERAGYTVEHAVSPQPRSSPLALTVLFMLMGGPIHPYEMQRRMQRWGKDQVVNLAQRASLYKTIERLREAGLVAVRHTERDQRFPERTVYELTEAGARTGRDWLIDMLSTPRNEFPRFPAAVSFIMGLTPSEALAVLEQRATLVRSQLAELERNLTFDPGRAPPRVALLDADYLRTMTAAELSWLTRVIEELRSGALTWSAEELARSAEAFLPDGPSSE
jgi:DNA-binding PadR family transcriptional regulator